MKEPLIPNPTFAHPSWQGRIGVAREDITPPVGIYARNWGAARHDCATGVHRPLTLTALTFQEQLSTQHPREYDEKPLVLIAADLGWWRSRDDEWFVRSRVLEALELDASRLMICLSHTHAGPVLGMAERDKPGGEFIEPYLESLAQSAIRAAQNALEWAQPRFLDWSYGHCTLATNRDLPDPNDASGHRVLVGFNPQKEADSTLLVGRVCDYRGFIAATIVNYACHPTTLAWDNKLISPDYIGAMRQVVETHNYQAPCLFLQGASGELAPREQYATSTREANRNGKVLGFAVMSVLQNMRQSPSSRLSYWKTVESGAPLAIWQGNGREESSTRTEARCIQIALALKSDWPTTRQIEIEIAACDDRLENEKLDDAPEERVRRATLRAERERLNRRLQTRRSLGDKSHGDSSSTRMPLWAWRLGDAILIGQPNEAYSLWQRELRARFPDCAVAVMNVVNGWYGYLPPREMYQKDVYSAWQTPFAAGGLELLIDESAKAVKEIMKEPRA